MNPKQTLSILLLAGIGLVASCGDSPTQPSLASAYRLAAVDGAPVPAVVASWSFESRRYHARIVGRSIEILSADSARYSWATDAVAELEDGTLQVGASECKAIIVAYRRSGDQLLLRADPSPPSVGFAPRPAVNDTLQVHGRRLVHSSGEPPSLAHPQGRVLRLEYEQGRHATPVCG